MRLEGVRIRNLGPFRDFAVDLNDYAGAKLIAVCGANGAGKSTLLELALPGALYRSTPTRGSLQELATARDAMLEARIVNGRAWTLRHLVDPVSGKSEAVVLDEHGRPAFDSSKVRDFDRWASQNLPPAEVLFSSIFGVQGSDGFLGMKPGERKSVLLRALGLERLEALAGEARERSRQVKQDIAVLCARIDDERARSGDVGELSELLRQSEAQARVAEIQEVEAKANLEAAEAEAREIEGLRKRAEELEARRGQLREAVAAAQARLRRLQAQTSEARELVARAESIRSAARETEELRVALASLEAQIQSARARRDAAEELERQRQRLAEEVTTQEAELQDIDRRIANNRSVLAEADAIRDAAEQFPKLEAERSRLEAALAAAQAEEGGRSRAMEALRAERARALARVNRLEATLLAKSEVDEAVKELHRVNNDLTLAKAACDTAAAELEALRAKSLHGAEERIDALRGALVEIRNGASDAPRRAETAIDQDDAAVQLAAELPIHLKAAQARVESAKSKHSELRSAQAQLEPVAARSKSLDEAARELTEANAEVERLAQAIEQADAEAARANGELVSIETSLSTLADAIGSLRPLAAKVEPLSRAEERLGLLLQRREEAEATLSRLRAALGALPKPQPIPELPSGVAEIRARLLALEPEAGQLEALARAQALLDGAEPQEAAAREEVARLEGELAAVPSAETALPKLDLPGARARALEAAERLQKARSAVAVVEQQLAAAREGVERIARLEADRSRLEWDLADWNRLASDLGRDGLQAAEIDAAGPELTELVNDLLHTCHGPRFTVSIETTRLSADGKRQLEGCEVRVIDTERGRDAEASTFSGGERVIIGEAVSLALAMLACRRSGIEGATLVRDESGAALDAANRPVYVAMLRRAADLVGAQHILFVSHDSQVVELADARIDISQGRTQ